MTGINCLLRHLILIGGFFKLNDSFLPFCSLSPVLSHQNKIQKDKEKNLLNFKCQLCQQP